MLRKGVELAEAIENIDIGGPSMIRAAAKNYRDVAILTDPHQYPDIIAELHANERLPFGRRPDFQLAKAAFAHTAHYDAAISRYLANLDTPDADFPNLLDLQYEERPKTSGTVRIPISARRSIAPMPHQNRVRRGQIN